MQRSINATTALNTRNLGTAIKRSSIKEDRAQASDSSDPAENRGNCQRLVLMLLCTFSALSSLGSGLHLWKDTAQAEQ